MKIYLISHKGSPQYYKICGWVDYDRVEPNGVYVKSVRAFLKKKEAKKYIEDNFVNIRGVKSDLEIKTAKIN